MILARLRSHSRHIVNGKATAATGGALRPLPIARATEDPPHTPARGGFSAMMERARARRSRREDRGKDDFGSRATEVR